MRKVFEFVKNHWLFLSLYSIIFLVIIICVYLYIDDEVKISEKDLDNQISSIFIGKNNKGVCVHDKRNKYLVSYKSAEKPSPDGEDTSIYSQVYGTFDNYYVATNSPWDIILYEYNNGYVEKYIINPCAVGSNDLSPQLLFDELYRYLKEGYSIHDTYLTPEDTKSTYHYLERIDYDTDDTYLVDTLWYNHYGDKLFFTKRYVSYYKITEDIYKTNSDIIKYTIGFLFLETLLFALFWYLRKKMKGKPLPSLKILKEKAKDNKSAIIQKAQKSDNAVTDAEYEVLLHKINPINFMNPYDAEKVKIANDLYSALLKSRDNETIIRMIEEKAKKTLNI